MYQPTVRARISFALPFHQDVGYLDAALRSVLAQTCPDWEAVVVDNSPTDLGAGAVVVAGLGDARIRYVRNTEALPMGRNWNRCLELPETELITVLHADDRLEPRYAEAMLAAVDRHPEPVAFFCGIRLIDERGRDTQTAADLFKRFLIPKPDPRTGETTLRGEAAARRLLRGNFLVVPSFCYRRERLGALRFSTRWRFVTDLDFYLRLLLRGDVLLGIPDVAFDWRRHGETTTAQLTRTLERFREEAEFLDEMAETMDAEGWHGAATEARKKTVRKLHLGFLAATDALRLRPRQAGAKLALMRRL